MLIYPWGSGLSFHGLLSSSHYSSIDLLKGNIDMNFPHRDTDKNRLSGRAIVGRLTATNFALPAGGIRRPHAADNMGRRAGVAARYTQSRPDAAAIMIEYRNTICILLLITLIEGCGRT